MAHPSFFIATLGCKVNQYESQALREAWQAAGLVASDSPENARIIVVNSCAVTAKAVADVRNAIRRMHRAAPDAALLVTGCAAQVAAEELAALPGVCAVVSQEQKDNLLSLFFGQQPEQVLYSSAAIEERVRILLDMRAKIEPFAEEVPKPFATPQNKEARNNAAVYPDFSVAGYGRSRAVVKVQDGCSHRCTYCIVPTTRGKARSRPLLASVDEARRLLQAGFREIVVSGVNLRQYGRDLVPQHDFWDLMTTLEKELGDEWQGRMRFRISSLEPGQLDEKALEVLNSSKLIAPHLHLSLQSGSLSVLRRMGRGHYDPRIIASFVERLSSFWPGFALGADILTAFPGETEEEHAETLALCRELPFSYAHVFPYSQRPHTPAATMAGQLPNAIKKQRAFELRECIREKQEAFIERALCLPELWVAPELTVHPGDEEESGTGENLSGFLPGVSEQYITCLIEHAPDTADDYSFIRVKPKSRQGLQLLVSPL